MSNRNPITRTHVKIVLIAICFLLLSNWQAFSQCKSPAGKVFGSISKQIDRNGITADYKQFMKNYSLNNFNGVYRLLSSNYLQSNGFSSSEDFATYKLRFYSDNQTKFISFLPEAIDEIIETDTWILRGCLIELVDGKRVRSKANLFIWKEKSNYRFSDITPVIVALDGKAEICP